MLLLISTFGKINKLRFEMIGDKIGHRLDPYLFSLYHKMLGANGTPNLLTLLGLLAMLLASFLVFRGYWVYAGLAILLSGIFDLFDGVIARRLNKVTGSVAFLTPSLIVTQTSSFFLALLLFYLKQDRRDLVILVFVVAIGTALVPYARARAEAAQVVCNIGLMEGRATHPSCRRDVIPCHGSVLWILASSPTSPCCSGSTTFGKSSISRISLRPRFRSREGFNPHPEFNLNPHQSVP